MKKCIILFLAITTIAISGCSPEDVVKIYVSEDGEESNTGNSKNTPTTLRKAIEAASGVYNKGKDVEVILLPGTYNITETIEITDELFKYNGGSLSVRGTSKSEVTISGGVTIPLEQARGIIAEEHPERFNRQAIDHLKVLDLKGVVNVSGLRNVGFARPYMPSWTELFINSQPMHIARWPNDSSVHIGEVIDPGSIPRVGDFSHRGAVFKYSVEQPDHWRVSNDVWIAGYFAHGYADDMVRVAGIDPEEKTIHTAEPTLYGFMTGADFRRWYALNLPEEIDVPGEYSIDREDEKIFFFPPERMQKIEVSVLSDPMVAIEGVHDIVLKNITFTCTRGMGVYLERSENCRVDHCVFHNMGSVAVCMGKGIAPFKNLEHEGTGIRTSRTIGSLSQHIYRNTTFNREAGKNNGVSNCRIYHTGAGGIHLGGGDRLTLEPASNYVKNCVIHDFNRIEKSYRPGIDLSGVGNRITKCEIYNAPSMAILLHGNDHVIEFCDIHHVCEEIDDQGAFYYGRDPSELGNRLQYNYIHDLSSIHNVFTIYHDDGACGLQVIGNVLYNAGNNAVLIGGGSDNLYEKNIFINSARTIRIGNRLQTWAGSLVEEGGLFEQRLNAVNYKESPYKDKYPTLTGYFENRPGVPQRNEIIHNILINTSHPLYGSEEWVEWGENWSPEEMPELEGLDREAFSLSSLKRVLKNNEYFDDIDFENMGVDHKKLDEE